MTPVVEQPTKPVQEAAKPPVAQPKPVAPVYQDDDPVCVVLRGWGTPELPPDKISYVDGYAATGGVLRNLPYAVVQKWVKLGLVSKDHIFPNNAAPEDFAEKMGRSPMERGTIMQALQMLSPEKIAALLGDVSAEKLARSILSDVKSRKAEEG